MNERQGWFVIMQEDEMKRFKNPSEVLVYMAIKSHCANGKQTAALSIRQIAERAFISKSQVNRTLPGLIANNLISITGTEVSRGGTVSVYKVSLPGTVNTRSVPHSVGSVPTLGTKLQQSNKVNIYINKFNELFTSNYQVTEGRNTKLDERLEKFSLDDILTALQNLSRSEWHQGVNPNQWVANPDFLIKNDEQVDKWLNVKQPVKDTQQEGGRINAKDFLANR